MKKILICMLVMVLGACSFRSPQSQFYVMNSNGLSAVSDKALNVAVARVKVPDMLDKAQMVVYDKDSSEVQILEFHRWAEVLPEVLQSALTNDLMAYLPKSYIKRTYFDSNTAQYSVNVEINRIEAYQGDKVVLSAWWNIADKKGHIVKRTQGIYTAKTHGDSIADLVDAESDAMHQMAREIAQTLVAL
ncbi:MAG: membrane integrity-associated transporter subunit PqiC [Alphaproteobacteria bacterium]|nr:membrane integrity-associated transporter subunit PqiC [Alphaproteobacteria bacterium]